MANMYLALTVILGNVKAIQVVLTLKVGKGHGKQLRLVTVRDQEACTAP